MEKAFCKLDGSVRVVFCTIAFGMGVNVECTNLALHFGPASCLDDYLQEVGRIGRSNDKQSQAVLLYVLWMHKGQEHYRWDERVHKEQRGVQTSVVNATISS